jgi:BirA family biotin operon repressor/biotin-[acetyl-CoA-carboxylase] ligase
VTTAAPPILRLAAVESTQDIAFELAARGGPDGAVVVADHQTHGHGRRGRAWQDEPGTSLLLSLLVRPRLPAGALPGLSFAAALAVADALAATAGLATTLKWPNDVRVAGKKIAGILLESRLGDDAATVVVVGIGVNLAQRRFPPELEASATSVLLETGHAPERDAVLRALLAAFAGWRDRLETDGFAPLRRRWLALTDTIGRPVRTEGRSGLAIDLDADGALLVQDGATVHRIVAGAVEG